MAGSRATYISLVAAAYNNVLHLTPRGWRSIAVEAGVGAAAAGGVLWLRSETSALRVAPGDAALSMATAGVLVGLTHVAQRRRGLSRLLADRRMAGMSPRRFVVHVGLRIPLLSGLAEEIIFRGVVWELLARAGGPRSATLWSSAAFGASHLAVAREHAAREGQPAAVWVAATVTATFAAGLALGWLRRVTGTIWSPAGVHTAANIVLSVTGRRMGSATSAGP